MKKLVIIVGLLICTGCSIASTDHNIAKNSDCLETFEDKSIKKPYQEIKTLKEEEIDTYMQEIGIIDYCIPSKLGTPFVNVDWDEAKGSDARGRKLSIGFTNLIDEPFGGWGRGFIEYSTYNFATGSEYLTYADQTDYEKVISSNISDEEVISLEGVKGFVRYKRQDHFEPDDFWVEKQIVFPFKDYYIAVVYQRFVLDNKENEGDLMTQFKTGVFPSSENNELERITNFAKSLKFSKTQ